MEVALLGDLHIGARNGNKVFFEQTTEFVDYFISFLKKRNINTVFQLGDVLDKRKTIDFLTSGYVIKFFEKFINNEIYFYGLLGNHDIFYRNNTDVSGIKQLTDLLNSPYVNIYETPTKLQIENTVLKLIPWMCDTNTEDTLKLIREKETSESIILGHFDLVGFEMSKGLVSKNGSIDVSEFGSQEVFTGHYHTPSDTGIIHYVGTPYQITWNDYSDDKRFIIYDTETNKWKEEYYRKNKFYKLNYEADKSVNDFLHIPEHSFIKIYVDEKTDAFNLFLTDFQEKYHPESLQVIFKEDDILEDVNAENINIDDPFVIMMKCLDEITIGNKDHVKDILQHIYQEAKEKEAQQC